MMCCNNCGWLRWVTTTITAYYCEFDGHPLSDLKDCCEAWKSTIQTNADRIRSMTDEELAEFLGRTKAYGCIDRDRTSEFVEWFRKWLKEEVEHDR